MLKEALFLQAIWLFLYLSIEVRSQEFAPDPEPLKYCAHPTSPENGLVQCSYANNIAQQFLCRFTCNDGYKFKDRPDKSISIFCLNGTYGFSQSSTVPPCVPICEDPDIPPFVTFSCINDGNGGKTCTAQCQPSYKFQSPPASSYVCHKGGIWSPDLSQVPKCMPSPGIVTDSGLATCSVWGDNHYRTFDSKVYSFNGQCKYILAYEPNIFDIMVVHDPACKSGENCGRSVQIYFSDNTIVLGATSNGSVVQWNGKDFSVPGSRASTVVEKVGHYITVRSALQFTVKWDGKNSIFVKVSDELKGKVRGLCGKFNGNPLDDFETEAGNLVTSVASFGSSWKRAELTDGIYCQDSAQSLGCWAANATSKQRASSKCIDLAIDPDFQPCHLVVDPRPYQKLCKDDCCGSDKEECMCETMEAYSRACMDYGVKLAWRKSGRCEIQCPDTMVYKECGSSCVPDCSNADATCFDQTCVDGCFCPDGWVLHGEKCVPVEQCPCPHGGKEYRPGDHITEECNTCTCELGKWNCTRESCDAQCSVVGHSHYTTFDGKTYDFVGYCSYYLMTNPEFHVVVDNIRCGNEGSACIKSVSIEINHQYVKLERNNWVFLDGHEVSNLPYQSTHVKISMMSSVFIQVVLDNGISISWDGRSRLYVIAPPSLKGLTRGLCGTYDGKQKMDFLTPQGSLETNANIFGNQYRTVKTCSNMPNYIYDDPCSMQKERKPKAEQFCKLLKGPLFQACHDIEDVNRYYENCMYDLCSCSENLHDCLCPSLGAYADLCAAKGVIIPWRQNVKECTLSCPGGQEYQVCGKKCERTCQDLAQNGGDSCDHQCVEGCNCPRGQSVDDQGECVPAEECPCIFDGRTYAASFKTLMGTELCECRGAKWQCSRISFSENIAQVEPLCPETMEFSSCAAKCSVTCENMNNPQACDETECKPSCVCKDGYVLDGDKCVAPSMCPCHHAGKAYYEGDTYFDDCNECVCKEQRWECEQKDCPSTCSAYGDSHYKTFDGLQYEFQGSCDYIMAQSTRNNPDKFVITTANMKCGTSGVTCSKGIELILGEEGTFSFYRLQLVRGKDPNPDPGSPFDVKEVGEMVYVTTPIGVTIQWDRATRVYITLSPKHMNMVEGLCGNFNGDLKDDFGLPSSGPPAARAITFGFSWRVHSYCTKSEEIEDTCSKAPQRRTWAHHRCSVLGSELFRPCHAVVEPSDYIKRCEFDACACDMGGDCECLCTAIAAYAHECATKGVHIKWRSKDLCGLACEDCQEYNPCMSLCPKKTCDNRLFYERISQNCENEQNVCFEGCDLHPCPAGQVYDSLVEPVTCIPEPLCDSPACEINGKKYREGERIDDPHVCNSMCEICNCRNGELEHITFGNCEHVIVTLHPPANTTITPTTDDTPAINCLKQGWTSWMSATIPTHDNIGDQETVAGLRNKYSFCHEDQITDIRCRVISQPEYGMYFGQKVTCNLKSGLTCHHKDQNGGMCLDYEVSYNCDCSKTTHHSDTTAFSTTISTLSTMETTKQVSLTEISTTTISTPTVSYTTGKNSTQYTSATSPPASSTPRPPVKSCGWTQWMNSGTPSQKGDLESMSNLRMVYSFCDYPVNIACRTVPDAKFPHGISYDKTRQMGITCSLNGGLVCLNSVQVYGQKCYDYEVAVRCVDGCRPNTDKTTIEPLTMPSHSTQESATPTLPLWSSTTGHNVYTYSLSTLGYTENMTNTFSTAKTSTTSETTPSFETSAHIHSSSPVFISTSSLASTSSTSPKVSSTSTATSSTTSHNSSPKSSSPSTSTSSILFSSDSTLTESSTSPISSTMYPTSSTHSVHSSTSPPVSKSSSTRSHDSSTTSLHTSTGHSNIPFSSSSGKSYFTSSTIDTSSSTGSTPSSTRTDILSSVSTSESSSTSTATSTSSTNPTKVTSPTSPSSSPSPTSSTTASTSSSINPSSSSINPDTTGILITNTYKTTFSTDQTTKNEKIVTSPSSSNPATASTGSSSAASTTLSTVINQETSSLSLTTSSEGTSTSSTEGPVSSYSEKTTTSVTDIKSKVCDDLFGLYSYSIASNDQFEASSSTGAAFDAHNARLNNLHSGQSNGGSWVPRPSDRAPYLLIDLKHPETISGVVTQGRHDAPEWVTKYIVSTSLDGKHFSPYSEEKDQSPKIFTANHDSNTPVKALFNREVVASKIKIFPLEFFNAPALRIDLLTCDGFATLTTLTTPDQGTTTANSRESEKTTPIIRTSDETSKESDKTTPTIRTSDETTRESDKTTPTIRTSDETTRESDKTTPTIRTSDETTRESDKTSPRIRTSDETTRESDKTTPTIRTSDETTRESDKTTPTIRTSDETTRESDKTKPTIRTSDETTRESDKTTPAIRTSDETTRESDKTTPRIRTSDETTRESDKTSPTIRTSDETTRESDKTTPTIRTSDETTSESDKTTPTIRTSDETTTGESDKTTPTIRTSDETTRESDKTTPTIKTSDETTRESDKTSPRIRTSDETTPRESDKTTPTIRTSDETTRESDKTTPTLPATTQENITTVRTEQRFSTSTSPMVTSSTEKSSQTTIQISEKSSIITAKITTPSWSTSTTSNTRPECTKSYWLPWTNRNIPNGINGDKEFLSTTELASLCNGTITRAKCATETGVPEYMTGEIVTCDLENGLVCMNEENGHRCLDYGITYWCQCGKSNTNFTQGPDTTTLSSTAAESTSSLPSSPMSTGTTKHEKDTTATTPQPSSSEITKKEGPTTTPIHITTDENSVPPSSSSTDFGFSSTMDSSQHSSVGENSTPTLPRQSTTELSDIFTTTVPDSTSSSATSPTRLRIRCAWSPWLNTDQPRITKTDKGDMETIDALKSKFGICPNMVDIECRVANSTTSAMDAGQFGVQCDVINGLRCYNRDTKEGLCYDYEVRVLCWDDQVCKGTTPLPPSETTSPTDFYRHTTVVCPPGKEWQPCAYKCNEVCHYKGGISGSCSKELLGDCVPGCKSVVPDKHIECPPNSRLIDDSTCVETSVCTCLKPDGSAAKPLEIWTNPRNPCSRCSCFNNQVICDSSDECTTGQSTTATTTVSSATSTTSLPRMPLCGWSSWINDDKPNTGSGDMELLSAMQSKYGFCAQPTSVECRPIARQSLDVLHLQVQATCNVLEGLKCYNHNNKNRCPDYEIRIFCPCPTVNVSRSTSTMSTVEQTRTSERSSVTSPTTSSSTSGVSSTEPTLSTTASMTSTTVPTESSTKSSVTSTQPLVTIKESESSSTEFTTHTYRMCGWTDWMSNSHLNPSGDIENLSGLRKNHVFCENSAILAIRCRDVKTHKSAEELGQKNVRCDLDMGLLCLNSEQDDSSKCADYEVSYFCEPVGVDCSDVIQTTLANKWTDTTPSVTSVVSSIFDQSTTTPINSRTSTVKVDITPVSDTTSTLGHSTTMLYSTNVTQSITSVHENMTGYTKDTWTTSVDTSSPPTFSESTSTTVPECKNPLLLTNSYLSASSSLSLYTGPDRSRLDTHHDTFHTGAWMPKVNNDEQWIKVTFPQPMMITAITTQGRESAPEWVKTYKIIYSSDNSTFHSIQTENGQSRIFLGNTDSNTKHTESVEPTLASVIFIEPQTWMNRIALRFEIHGCYGLPPTNDTVNTTGSTPTTPTEVTPPHESLVPEMCLKEMGMLDHRVTANMLSASSFRDFAHAPYKARLGEDKSWIPAAYDRSPYIQVNFGEQQIISGVTTQGKPDAPVYVKTFKVFYSNDGIKWVPLRDTPQSDKIFYANWDSVTPVTNFFLRPLRAQFFRIQPLRWNNGIALRFELHGCPVSIFTTTEATTLKADTSKTTLSTAMSTTSMPVTETREKCVEWDQWIDLNHPSLSSPNDVEPISDLISQSLHCSNPVAIECRTATPSQLTPSESGQNVTCNLLEGLKCLSKDVKEPICHNFEARIGCVKEVPECLQQSTLPPPVQLCYPGIDAHHCPQSCPQGTYCDGYKCVIKSDCPCILDQKIVRPSGVERNENCGICQCLNGEIYCMPPTQCPTCIQGYRYRNRTSCECECLMCDVDEFQCGDTTCIPKLKQCDGVVDCIDDELGCEQTTVFTPPSTTAKAHNGSTTLVVTPSQTTHDFRTTASKEMVSTTTARTSMSTPEPPKQCHFLQTTKTVGGVDVKLAVSQEIVHKIGEKWSDGLCRSCSCASGVNGDTKVFCTEEDCTPCKVGERRLKKAGSCCGVCEPYGCVVDGLVYKAGEVLRSKKKCYTSKCQKDLYNKAFIIQETQVECERMENLTPCSPGSSAFEHYDASGCCLVCVPPNLWHNATSSVCETCTPRLVTGDSSKTVGYFKITLESGAYCYNMSPIPDLKQCDGYCGSTSIYTEVMQGFESHCKCCQPNTTTAVAVQLKCSDGQFLTKHYDVPETCACMPCSGKI